MALRPTLGRLWAQSGKRVDPGVEKYKQGWTAEIPPFETLNHLQYQIDLALLAQTERGAPEWGNDVAYYKGALAWDNTDEKIYIAKVANPSRSLVPSANLSQWEPSAIQISTNAYEAANARFDAHVADVSNPHKVTAAQAGTYTKAQIDTKVSAIKSNTDAHKADKNNPHGTTAAQIGAVPIAGGTYTGDVTFNTTETKINPGAGDHAISADTTFFGLRFGTFRLGIDKATGRAVIKSGSTADFLMNEAEYVEKRRAVEGEYAVPSPDCWIDAASDINLKQGFGFTELIRASTASYTDKSGVQQTAGPGEPRITAFGLTISQASGERLEVTAHQNYQGFSEGTLMLEAMWDASANGGLIYLLTDNSPRQDLIFVATNGDVTVQFEDNAGQLRKFIAGRATSKVAFKMAVTWNSQTTRTYFNGTPGQFGDLSFSPSTKPFTRFTFGIASVAANSWYHLRTFKSWAKILTAKQISTL
jgi:hypothetical protein